MLIFVFYLFLFFYNVNNLFYNGYIFVVSFYNVNNDNDNDNDNNNNNNNNNDIIMIMFMRPRIPNQNSLHYTNCPGYPLYLTPIHSV
jgi:hypothetical protein